jgi:hypothetical protein
MRTVAHPPIQRLGESRPVAEPRKAFLDANVLRGQLTTDTMLSLAHARLFEPHWSEQVLDVF